MNMVSRPSDANANLGEIRPPRPGEWVMSDKREWHRVTSVSLGVVLLPHVWCMCGKHLVNFHGPFSLPTQDFPTAQVCLPCSLTVPITLRGLLAQQGKLEESRR